MFFFLFFFIAWLLLKAAIIGVVEGVHTLIVVPASGLRIPGLRRGHDIHLELRGRNCEVSLTKLLLLLLLNLSIVFRPVVFGLLEATTAVLDLFGPLSVALEPKADLALVVIFILDLFLFRVVFILPLLSPLFFIALFVRWLVREAQLVKIPDKL